MAPDGPRGPLMHCAPGVIELARHTGAPIVPASISSQHGKILNSWDRFLVPRLFDRLVCIWGEPVTIPKDTTDIEPYRLLLAQRMTAVQQEADKLCGRPEQIHPAEGDKV